MISRPAISETRLLTGKETIENRTFAEIAVGDSATLTRTLSEQDISLFAAASGDINPTHLDSEYMKKSGRGGVVGHSLWGGALMASTAEVRAPTEKWTGPAVEAAGVMIQRYDRYKALIERCSSLAPVAVAVAHPCEETALRGAIEAAEAGLIHPTLVGARQKILQVAAQCGLDLEAHRIVDVRAQPRGRSQVGRSHPRGRGRGLDERQPAYR